MPPKKAAAPKKKTGPKNNALAKPVHITEELAAIVGKGPLPRSEITKKVWVYIKKHNLQDPANKKMIMPDTLLAKVIGHAKIDMFEMVKRWNKHVKKD
jgi:chromatin remodeling complex protein RSC6